MLSELFTWVLKTYLGKYLDDFNPAQLSVALLSGEVELENVPIKKDALRSLNIPLRASSGNIGRIKLRIPVRQFRTTGLCVEIENVYGVFSPTNIDDLEYEKEKTSEYELKLELLDEIEARWKSEKRHMAENYYSSSYSSWLRYGTSTMTDILENLELKIINVHLRYEDPNLNCSGGIMITSLTAQACNSNWIAGANTNDKDISYKILQLENFSLYWDKITLDQMYSKLPAKDLQSSMTSLNDTDSYQFIIQPLTANVQWKRERCKQSLQSKERPRLSFKIFITSASISISTMQYIQIIETISALQKLKNNLANRLKRPSCKISQNAGLWWKYAARCCGLKCTFENKWETLKDNLHYIKLYKRLLTNPNENVSNEDKEFKLFFEKNKSLLVLQTLRSVCWSKVYSETVSQKSQNGQARNILFHWFPNWRGWYKTPESNQSEVHKNAEDDILSAIEDSVDTEKVFSQKDAVFGHFSFSVTNGNFTIYESETFDCNTKNFFELNFQLLTITMEISPCMDNFMVGLSLGSVALKEITDTNTVFPFLIKSEEIPDDSSESNDPTTSLSTHSEIVPWFKLQWENRQAKFNSDIILSVKSKSLDLFYNITALKRITSFFYQPLQGLDWNSSKWAKKGGASSFTLLNKWKNLLVTKKKRQNVWNFEIDVKAPRIILAENIFNPNTNIVLLDFGRLKMFKNETRKRTNPISERLESICDDDLYMTPCSTPPGSEISYLESPVVNCSTPCIPRSHAMNSEFENTIYKSIYHKYFFDLTDLEISTCNNKHLQHTSSKHFSNFNVLQKFDIELKVEQRIIETTDPEYPHYVINANLPKLIVCIDEQKIGNCLQILHPVCYEIFSSNPTSKTFLNTNTNTKDTLDHNTANTCINLQFFAGQLIFEVQSHDKSLVELQVIETRAGLKIQPNFMHARFSVHGLLLVDAIQSFGSDFELLLASHHQIRVDTKSGTLRKSSFSLHLPQDSDSSLERNKIEDKLDAFPDDIDFDGTWRDENALINMNIIMNNSCNENEASENTLNLSFNALDVIANPQTFLELAEFSKQIFSKINSLHRKREHEIEAFNDERSSSAHNIKLCFNFNRLNLLVIRTLRKGKIISARKLGTLVVTHAEFQASLLDDVCAKGSLGGIQINDITTEELPVQRVFSAGIDTTTDPFQNNNQKLLKKLFPENYDLELPENTTPKALTVKFYGFRNEPDSLNLQASCFYYTHCPTFIFEMIRCISELNTLTKSFAEVSQEDSNQYKDRQTTAVTLGQEYRMMKSSKGISFDVLLHNPIIILRRPHNSADVLVINLGKFYAYNNNQMSQIDLNNSTHGYAEMSNLVSKDCYFLCINNISIHSAHRGNGISKTAQNIPSDNIESYEFWTLSYDSQFLFTVSRSARKIQTNTNAFSTNTFTVNGNVTPLLQISLSPEQFEQIAETLNYFSTDQFKFDDPPQKHNVNKWDISLNFSIPILQIYLKSTPGVHVLNGTIRSLNVKYVDIHSERKLQLLLKSVQLEDEELPEISKFRYMLKSSENVGTKIYKNPLLSSSSPDLVQHENSCLDSFGSMPSKLDLVENNIFQAKKFFYELIDSKTSFDYCGVKTTNNNAILFIYNFQKKEKQAKCTLDFKSLDLRVMIKKWQNVVKCLNVFFKTDAHHSTHSKGEVMKGTSCKSVEFNISIRSLNITLGRDQEEFAKISIAYAFFKTVRDKAANEFEGQFTSVTVTDLTPYGELYGEKFSIIGPENIFFLYKRWNLISGSCVHPSSNYDAYFQIKIPTVRYIHTKRFLAGFLEYIGELQNMFIDINAGDKKEFEGQKEQLGIKFEVDISSVKIILPIHYKGNEVLLADFEEFTAINRLGTKYKGKEKSDPAAKCKIVETISINACIKSLCTAERVTRNGTHFKMKINENVVFTDYGLSQIGHYIFNEKSFFKLKIDRLANLNMNPIDPHVIVTGKVSNLYASLNNEQYNMIKNFFIYNLGEVIKEAKIYEQSEGIESVQGNELSSQSSENKPVWKLSSVKFFLDDIKIYLTELSSREEHIASIDLIKSCLELDYFSDGSQNLDVILYEVSLIDSRDNKIMEHLIKSNQMNPSSGVLAEFSWKMRTDRNKLTLLLNNFRLIAIMASLRNLVMFFREDAHSRFYVHTQDRNQPLTPFEMTVNVTESEVVLIEDLTRKDSNTLVMKLTTAIVLKPYDESIPLSATINYLEVFSCGLDEEERTPLSIIDPCVLCVELRGDCCHILSSKQFSVRLSYNDIRMFTGLIKSLQREMRGFRKSTLSDNDFDVIAPLIAMGFSQRESLFAMEMCKNKINDAAKWLSQRKTTKQTTPFPIIYNINLSAREVSICIIDDCMDSDVPLVELTLNKFTVQHCLRGNTTSGLPRIEGSLEATISSDYYNRQLSGWEPFIESWKCDISWSYPEKKSMSNNSYNFCISSAELLRCNVTTSLIELYDIVRQNWWKDYCDQKVDDVDDKPSPRTTKCRTPFEPFALRNLTGEPLVFKTIISQPGGITRTEIDQKSLMRNWIPVQANETIAFNFGPHKKWRYGESRKINLHQIFVQVHGWSLIGPITVDKVGTYFRYATIEMEYSKKTRIVFDISMIGSAQKLITVRSALQITNYLDVDMTLKLESRNHNPTVLIPLNAGGQLCIPLSLVNSFIYAKPNYDAYKKHDSSSASNEIDHEKITKNYPKYDFCRCRILWIDCYKDSLRKVHACRGHLEQDFYYIVEIKRERFSKREVVNLPGHSISFYPPLKIQNLLCLELIIKIENCEERIKSSEELNFHKINAYEAFFLSIRAENYKMSGQLKIPPGHVGTVEPKLKLFDYLNRELNVRVSIQSYQGRGLEIYISAPIWLVNRTGLPLIFRQEGTNYLSAGQFDENENACVLNPLMFSFSDENSSPSLEIRLGKSYGQNNMWCSSFNLQKSIFYRELKAESTDMCYKIGISVQRGRGQHASTISVLITPRFELCNKSSKSLQFARKHDILKKDAGYFDVFTVPTSCNYPFHWPNLEHEHSLCVRIDEESCHWSKGFSVKNIQSLYINVRNNVGEMHFLRLEVVLRGAMYNLLFTDAYFLPPPIRIDNFSEVPIKFWQTDCQPSWKTSVQPQSSLAYVLDDPVGTISLQIEAPGGNIAVYPINKFGTSCSVSYPNYIYIAFKETFIHGRTSETELVLGVKDKKVILTKKNPADRSQLWLMNASGQLEHEGSSAPAGRLNSSGTNAMRMILDIEKSLNPMEHSFLTVRTPNKQRSLTQTWRIENERLSCHTNMCVQASELCEDAPAILGRIDADNLAKQSIETQRLRPGSGQLEIRHKIDGPTHVVKVYDVKMNSDDLVLSGDPKFERSPTSFAQKARDKQKHISNEYLAKVTLSKGISVSVITRQPFEELAYATLENLSAEIGLSSQSKSLTLQISYLQIDNQTLDSTCPVLLHTVLGKEEDNVKDALMLAVNMVPSINPNAVVFDKFTFYIQPFAIYLEERFILKTANTFGFGKTNKHDNKYNQDWKEMIFGKNSNSENLTRYYFESLLLGATQVHLSVITSPKLSPDLHVTKKAMGLTLIKFGDVLIELERFVDKYHFESLDVYIKAIKEHYINQIKLHAASILGSVDFLGNPLGLAYDLSEGVSGLIFEGSVKSLVKNVTHGISDSTAKLTETLSDSLGKVVLDDHDKETRQKILELQQISSGGHLNAGIRGLGFGLLGGVTSIVRHTYDGVQSDGLPGFLSGLGKGLVGTVTKPIIGILDLTSEAASAVRESSRDSHKNIPNRKRLPRCVTGAAGNLLPPFSYRQSKGQQYLYILNRRNLSEKLLSYEPNLYSDRDTKLGLLVSTEFVRIFSRGASEPSVILEYHINEVLSCHPLTTTGGNVASSSSSSPNYYIEISTNLPKITRPRIRCNTEEMAEKAARYINYAKIVFDEREGTLISD